MDQIQKDLDGLGEDERLAPAQRLLAAGERDPPDEVERAWDWEIRERIARYDRGETPTRPAAEVFADLDRKLGL